MSCKAPVLEKHCGDYAYPPAPRDQRRRAAHALRYRPGGPDRRRGPPAAFETIKAVLADAAPWLRGVTEDSLLREALAGAEAFRLKNLAGQLAKKPVFCISGDMDIYTPPRHNCLPLEQAVRKAGGTQFRRLSLYTDHCFSDYRLTVAQRISDYLSALLSTP